MRRRLVLITTGNTTPGGNNEAATRLFSETKGFIAAEHSASPISSAVRVPKQWIEEHRHKHQLKLAFGCTVGNGGTHICLKRIHSSRYTVCYVEIGLHQPRGRLAHSMPRITSILLKGVIAKLLICRTLFG